jgi:hypothetical protein
VNHDQARQHQESPKDEETRKIILLFLPALKRYQVKALSLNTALGAVIRMSPQGRAALTPDSINASVMCARQIAEKTVEREAAKLEQALRDDKHALLALQAFASTHLRD